METKIMYVCERCAENFPEACGHYDANDLRLTPDGEQVCESCWDDEPYTSPDWGRLRRIQRWAPIPARRKPCPARELAAGANKILRAATALLALQAKMIEWRSLAQEMTPGGSEFMTPDAVRAYYRDFKDRYHEAKCNESRLRKEFADLQAENERLKDELKNARLMG